MVRTHARRDPAEQAMSPARGACVLATVMALVALLLAPFIATVSTPRTAPTPQITQVVSNPSQATKRCLKKILPGQANACASSSMPVAGLDNRGGALAPVPLRSSLAPLSHHTLIMQCCGVPPDRPPRFA